MTDPGPYIPLPQGGGGSQGYWDPHLGVASRQAQTPHQWSTVGEASGDPAPCSSGFQINHPCRGREHLPQNFGQKNFYQNTFYQPYTGRTRGTEIGADNVPVWKEVKPAKDNRVRNPEGNTRLSTWTDDNYWKVLQDESQRRTPVPGS